MAQTGYTPLLIYASGTASNVPSAANLTSSASGAELALNYADGKLYFKNSSGVVTLLASAAGASGDVVGPASATDNALARFDTTTGKLIQNSVGILSDAGALSGLTDITASGNVTLSGGTANGVAYLNGSKVLTTGSALTFDGTNLGVGTSSPSSFSGYTTVSVNNATNGGIYNILVNGTETARLQACSGIFNVAAKGAATNLTFETNGAERMRLDTSGNLGIGTSSPQARLHINSGAGSTQFRMGPNSTSSDRALINYNSTTNRFTIDMSGNDAVVVDGSGNLGLGVTPSAWDSTYKAIQVGARSMFYGIGSEANMANNAYYNSGYKYVANSAAGLYTIDANVHKWYNAASGTAGNAISFSQSMTLDASGNLLVGTTSALTSASGRGNVTINGTDAVLAFGNSNSSAGYVYAASTNLEISAASTRYINFLTNNTERARILSSGEVLAGATAAVAVAGVTGFHALSADANNKWAAVVRNTTSSTPFGLAVNYSAAAPNNTSSNFVYCYDSGALRASIRANGGLANYQANNVDLSDARTKKDIIPAASMWGKVSALEIVTYKYNDQTHDDVNLGVIAQQVETVEPVWVDADGFGDTPEDGVPLKTVYTKDITFAAIKALQEAMARIETLEAKVTALESK